MKFVGLWLFFTSSFYCLGLYGYELSTTEDYRNYFNVRINKLFDEEIISSTDVELLEPNEYVLERYDAVHKAVFGLQDDIVSERDKHNFKKFAEAGNIRAMYYYAMQNIYDENNCEVGLYWLNNAYENGLVMAAVRKGHLIRLGLCGVERSEEKSVPYYEVGLRALEPESIYMLAILLKKGVYKPAEDIDYFELIEISAIYGLPVAQLANARNYLGRDNDLAMGWLILCYLQGDIEFLDDISSLNRKYGAHISQEVRKIFKAIGWYRYYQFGYVDVFGGNEYF